MGLRQAVILTANLGGFDVPQEHVPQSVPHDTIVFTDDNFPPRSQAMTPRLQSKIPKCFGWQMAPGYEYYLWLDANINLTHPDALKFFIDSCKDYEMVVFRHPRRPNMRQEIRYTRKGLREQSMYLVGRYDGELLREQTKAIESDKTITDNLLACGGMFMYRDTPAVREAMKEWWYNISRYIVQDQIAFPYALKKAGVKVNALNEDYTRCEWLAPRSHKYHGK